MIDWRQDSGEDFGLIVVWFSGICWVSFQLLLQDGRHTLSCRGSGRVGRDRPSPAAPTLPRHGGRLIWWLPVHIRGARHFLFRRLESLYEVSSGRWWRTSSRGPGVGKVPEFPGPFLWRNLGSHGLVRVRWGAIVPTSSNPRRVARPHDGAEGGVCSGHGRLATSRFPTRVWSLAEAGGCLCLEWAAPAGGVILPRRFSSSYAFTSPLRGKYSLV